MLPSRTQFAFTCSARRLFEYNARVYMWTYTFRRVPLCDDWAMRMWHGFQMRFTQAYPLAKGVRVFELHASHGIHYHALLNFRCPVQHVVKIAWPFGFGRISVVQADDGSCDYLAKYLTKDYVERNPTLSRRRRWGTIGAFDQTRKADLVYETDGTRNKVLIFGKRQVHYCVIQALNKYSHCFGHFNEWPLKAKVSLEMIRQQYEPMKGKVII